MDDNKVLEAINALQEAAYNNSFLKGFHDESKDLISAIQSHPNLSDAQKEALVKYFELADDAKRLMLMTSELGEALEGLRKDNVSDKIPEFTAEEEELADAVIRVLDHAGKKKLRLGESILAKMDYNSGRSYKHGKAF